MHPAAGILQDGTDEPGFSLALAFRRGDRPTRGEWAKLAAQPRGQVRDWAKLLSQAAPITLRISCRVGAFGDSTLERDRIDDIRSRLGELTGAFTSKPLPSGW